MSRNPQTYLGRVYQRIEDRVECPQCGAERETSCHFPNGKVRWEPHAKRAGIANLDEPDQSAYGLPPRWADR